MDYFATARATLDQQQSEQTQTFESEKKLLIISKNLKKNYF